MDSVSIGLDIGSTAIRAAEIGTAQNQTTLRRYGQVGIPHGYVVDGEIVNGPGVAAALRRLWVECGFSSNKVVLGVSGARVFVRQAELPALSPEELRSSLKFDAQELVPIPMEDACFDFSILEQIPPADGQGQAMVRVLLVAAHRDLLGSYLAVLKEAGLEATAIDASPMSMLRVVPATGADGQTVELETIVSIGAELTTVAVREHGLPRFIRTLTVGGSKLTEALANTLHLEMAVAERIKRGASDADIFPSHARKSMTTDVRDLAEDVRATVDFFLMQSGRTTIDRLLITGGASQTEGLAAAIAGTQTLQVARIDPFAAVALGSVGLSPEDMERASYSAASAVGLALWNFDKPELKLSLLPEEVAAARKERRIIVSMAAGLAGLIGLLGVASVAQTLEVHKARHQVAVTQGKVTQAKAEVAALQAQTAVHGQVVAKTQLVVTALKGDIDWVRVLKQLADVMPPNTSLTAFSGARTASVSSAATAGASGLPAGVGTVNFSVVGTGGLPSVSAWLRSLQQTSDFSGVWVASVSSNGPSQASVTFTSNGSLTTSADSGRTPGGQQ